MNWQPLALFLLLLLTALVSKGQNPDIDPSVVDSDQIQLLRTLRGDIFFGKTQLLQEDSLSFLTQQQLQLHYAINEIEWLGFVENAGWLKDQIKASPEMNRLFQQFDSPGYENLAYSFTAFAYPKGTKEYRNIDLLYNTLDVGIGEHFSLGGGMIIPFFVGFRTKLAFDLNEIVHLGAGMNTLVAYGPDLGGIASHFFAIATFGNPQQYFNITAGPAIDWTYIGPNPFVLTVGGGFSFSNHWRVYTDIGFTPSTEGFIPTLLFSWFNQRNRLEFGVLTIPEGLPIVIPLLSYARRF